MMTTCKQEDDDLAKLRWELLSLHQTLVLAISLVRGIYANNNILENFQLYIEWFQAKQIESKLHHIPSPGKQIDLYLSRFMLKGVMDGVKNLKGTDFDFIL